MGRGECVLMMKMIAKRDLEHSEILGRDAMMWLPQFTKHRTNHTNLAADWKRALSSCAMAQIASISQGTPA